MVDYSDDDLKRARGIVEGLSEDLDRPLQDLEDGLSVVDLQTHFVQFYDNLSVVEHLHLEFPAVRLPGEGVVPVALSELVGVWPIPYFTEMIFYRGPIGPFRDWLGEKLRRTMRRFGDAATELSPREARTTFFSRASEFLASRLAGRRTLTADGGGGSPPPSKLTMPKFFGGPPTKVSGCLFSIHTNSPGLSTYWSGAYLISSNYFSAPTTPAKGVLQAGTYIFGVNGGAYGGGPPTWDFHKVCTLPGTPKVRLQF